MLRLTTISQTKYHNSNITITKSQKIMSTQQYYNNNITITTITYLPVVLIGVHPNYLALLIRQWVQLIRMQQTSKTPLHCYTKHCKAQSNSQSEWVEVKGELHSKVTLRRIKGDLKANCSSFLVFKINPSFKRKQPFTSKYCTHWSQF